MSKSKEKKALPDLSMYDFRTTFISLEYPMHFLSPVMGREKAGEKSSAPSLLELGEELGLNTRDKSVEFLLQQHQKRFQTYKSLYVVFSLLGYLLIGGFALTLFAFVAVLLFDFESTDFNVFIYVFIFMLAYIAFKTASRIVSVLVDHYYADTLSFVTCLYLLANLAKENALARARDRNQLVRRARALRKYLILLPYQFQVTDAPSHSWARQQFRLMEQFAEAKENQIIAPSTGSQMDIFAELRAFLEILLTGNYGEFKYESPSGAETALQASPSRSTVGSLLKFLGTITPLIILLLLYFFPKQLGFLGIENRVISLVSLAWLLLAIDSNLRLGIVERISTLAKAIKELS